MSSIIAKLLCRSLPVAPAVLATLPVLVLLAPSAAAAGQHWEVGAKLQGMNLMRDGITAGDYGGFGVMLRFRPGRVVGLELATDVLSSDEWDQTSREIFQLNASLLVYFVDVRFFELYGVGGIGSNSVHWSDSRSGETHGRGGGINLHTGLGAQLVLGRFRLFSEIRFLLLAPLHDDGREPGVIGGDDEEAIRYYVRSPASDNRIFTSVDGGLAGPLLGSVFTMGCSLGW
ncbi:MAG: porin family protein [Deltaproteobacteria bacterium]|nr:porin family protein [Deltaproteobacteria bacterium]